MRNISLLIVLIFVVLSGCKQKEPALPNIVIIYADDMGYGDLNCQNPNSKIPTPNLDNLASQGIRFTDAHSSSGICSPSRFALLTGMYHWRRQHGIVGSFGNPFFKNEDVTLPQILKTKGYKTACIGKWHLGWDWNFTGQPSGEIMQWGKMRKYYQSDDVDWTQAVSGGPLDRGFDYYFGDGTINFPPYTWFENDRPLEVPTETMTPQNIGYETKEGHWEFRPGPRVKGWNPYKVLPTLAKRTQEWIGEQSNNEPFFLYFALPSPHAPIIPNDEFDGKSNAGAYGDFMFQTDYIVGQVMEALKAKGLDENTIVIFSADNGPEIYAYKRAVKYDHFSMGDFRGLKRDVWEGGHHVPFIVKWPNKVKAGSVSKEVISQIDIMATVADAVGIELPAGSAPDSYSMLPVLKGESLDTPLREVTIHNTYANKWGIRKGDWLYINQPDGAHNNELIAYKELRAYKDNDTPGLLFNIKNDPEQRNNLFENHPDKVDELSALLEDYRKESCSYKKNN